MPIKSSDQNCLQVSEHQQGRGDALTGVGVGKGGVNEVDQE